MQKSKTMKIHLDNEYKKTIWWCKTIEIIPTITVNLFKDYKFESIRLSWLGFTIGFYKQ